MPMYSSLTTIELKMIFSNGHEFNLSYHDADPEYGDASYYISFVEYKKNEDVARENSLFLEREPLDESVLWALEEQDVYLEDAFEAGCQPILLSRIVGAKSLQEIVSIISGSLGLYIPNKDDFITVTTTRNKRNAIILKKKSGNTFLIVSVKPSTLTVNVKNVIKNKK